MKFITSVAVAATTLAAIASAQNALGAAAKTVNVQLMAGPQNSIHFIADLGTIDCSNATVTNALKRIPDDTVPGTDYSIKFVTDPLSYSYQFKIINPKATPEPQQPPTPPAEQNKPDEKVTSAAGSLVAGSMIAAAGVAVAALQFVL
ncbi:hypothetical protein BGX24_006891 [Mortierella sp. AD032]|nr:hypothetical protein BGX24_006891 [Mortierella sp. AD032]